MKSYECKNMRILKCFWKEGEYDATTYNTKGEIISSGTTSVKYNKNNVEAWDSIFCGNGNWFQNDPSWIYSKGNWFCKNNQIIFKYKIKYNNGEVVYGKYVTKKITNGYEAIGYVCENGVYKELNKSILIHK